MLELANFKQKEIETIKFYYDLLYELIYKCSKYNVVCTTLEFNINFILGLRKEWKNIYLIIKTQENFDTYSLSNLYNILKAHESEVKEINDETNKMNFVGPLAVVLKNTVKEACFDDEGGNSEKGLLIITPVFLGQALMMM